VAGGHDIPPANKIVLWSGGCEHEETYTNKALVYA